MVKQETLCFRCDNFNCRWRKCLKEVAGWNACPSTIKYGKQNQPSYIVISCPEFKRNSGYENDEEWERLCKKKQRTIYHALADIYTEGKQADFLTESRIRDLVLEIKNQHEREMRKQKMKFRKMQAEYLRINEEYRQLVAVPEQKGAEQNAAD